MRKNIKKITFILIASLMSLSIITPVSAQDSTINNINDFEYTYEYKGIQFTGNTELSKEQLELMYNEAMNANINPLSVESDFGTFAEDPGSNQSTVVAPYYRTYKNTGAKIAADAVVTYLVNKVPKKIKTTALGSWVLSRFEGWAEPIKTTYVGSWITSSWSNYQNKRIYHATLVHYNNSNYTSPKTIQYYEVTHMYE